MVYFLLLLLLKQNCKNCPGIDFPLLLHVGWRRSVKSSWACSKFWVSFQAATKVRRGDCVGTVQGFVLKASISWDHREVMALLHQGWSRTRAGKDAAWLQVAAAGLSVSTLCCGAGTHAAQPGLCSGRRQGNLGLAGRRAWGLRACPFCPRAA